MRQSKNVDFNDLQQRLKRVSNALGKQYDNNVKSHMRTTRRVISFGNFDESELDNRVMGMISAFASLKDHMKEILKNSNRSPQLVEDMIDSSLELKLIMDLWNQDKHGYPLKKFRRSNLNPKIINITQGVTLTDRNASTMNFTINMDNPDKPSISITDDMVIQINGQIVDERGDFIITLNNMLYRAINEIEKFINKHKLV